MEIKRFRTTQEAIGYGIIADKKKIKELQKQKKYLIKYIKNIDDEELDLLINLSVIEQFLREAIEGKEIYARENVSYRKKDFKEQAELILSKEIEIDIIEL